MKCNVNIIEKSDWIYYLNENPSIKRDTCGKWQHFTSNLEHAKSICYKAVEEGAVKQAKHRKNLNPLKNDTVCCFYLDGDDLEGHKIIITFMLENNLIPKTKAGKLHNISFKFDNQTRNNEYGSNFKGEIKLEQFIDLSTGKWII